LLSQVEQVEIDTSKCKRNYNFEVLN
jgi:hypothetical protein